MADMFDEQQSGGDFDGAFRERAAPKVPPRRRRGAAAGEDDDSSSAGPEPAVKKTGGWADEGSVSQQPMGRRRDAAATETQAVDAPAASKFDDDDDIPVIPDLEENDEDDITLTVAEPGSISNSFLPTNLKLDTGSLPPPQVRPLLRCTGRCLQWRPPPTGLLEHGRVALPGCP
jgi:hypothetical protein